MDREHLRFAFSPLAEVIGSVRLLDSGRIAPRYQEWFDQTRTRLRRVDMETVRTVVPPATSEIANCVHAAMHQPSLSIDTQLADLEAQTGRLAGTEVEARTLDNDTVRRVVDALHQYWSVAIEPHWPRMRPILDADVSYREAMLAAEEVGCVLADIHPDLQPSARPAAPMELVLAPSVFVGSGVLVELAGTNGATVTYPPRNVGEVWSEDGPLLNHESLRSLLGSGCSEVLLSLDSPRSVADLAREVGDSTPAVVRHLELLTSCDLVRCQGSGRRRRFRRSSTAIALLSATGVDPVPER